MSPSAFIVTRVVKTGKRYHVRYRFGGRGYKPLHGGSFPTLTLARARRDLIAGELAAGRDPRAALHALANPAPTVTVKILAEQWANGRVDVGAKTLKQFRSRNTMIIDEFGHKHPDELTPADVTAWIQSMLDGGLAPGTIQKRVQQLRLILDLAETNAARHRLVKLPRIAKQQVEPPSASDVAAIVSVITKKFRLPVRVLEQTGCRVGELVELVWGDVDVRGSRFRVVKGKTPAARRWVAMPAEIAEQVDELLPAEDRTPDRKVFAAVSITGLQKAMTRACNVAGIAHYHPHDLRHRYVSVQIQRGVSITDLSAQVGHTSKAVTLDTYAHVLLEEGDE